jgi:di/tricarboxylate transporter
MSVPYGVLLLAGALSIYARYRRGFAAELPQTPVPSWEPLSAAEWRTAVITAGAAALWLTDALPPALPAMLALACLLAPGVGVVSWGDFERGVGWANFFVIASSLSLAGALVKSGASAWLAGLVVQATPSAGERPVLVVIVLLAGAALVRLIVPNITGFLATTIPVAMSVGAVTGLNPVVCGLVVTIAGDAVLYYPAQSASSLVVYQRGHLSAPEIFRFGVWMTLLAALVVLAVALPYWSAIGEPLRLRRG